MSNDCSRFLKWVTNHNLKCVFFFSITKIIITIAFGHFEWSKWFKSIIIFTALVQSACENCRFAIFSLLGETLKHTIGFRTDIRPNSRVPCCTSVCQRVRDGKRSVGEISVFALSPLRTSDEIFTVTSLYLAPLAVERSRTIQSQST